MKYTPIDSTLFIENRTRFVAKMQPGSMAFFNANDEMPRDGDANYLFRQNSDLFYLSGIDQEQTVLVLFPDAPFPKYREILFVRKTNEHIAVWEGHKYTKEEGKAASGIENIMWTESFEQVLHVLSAYDEGFYLNMNDHDRAYTQVPYKEHRFSLEMRDKYPLHKIERSAPIMHHLRSIKSHWEVELMRKACGITEKAFRRVLGFVKPGVWEHEVEAEIIHEFLINRATGHAYHRIIASGASACVLHYIENNKQCKDGDLLLMDFGSEYANYNSDLTRCIPVNGKFSPRQKDVYNAVLNLMKYAQSMLVPCT